MTHLSAFRSESCKARYLAKYDEVLKDVAGSFIASGMSARGLVQRTHRKRSGGLLLLFHGASTTAVLWQP